MRRHMVYARGAPLRQEDAMAEPGSGRKEGLFWRVLVVLCALGVLGVGVAAGSEVPGEAAIAATSVTRVGKGSYSVTWGVPPLTLGPVSEVVALDKDWSFSRKISLPSVPIPGLPDWVEDTLEWVKDNFPLCVPSFYDLDFNLSASAEIDCRGSFLLKVTPPSGDLGRLTGELLITASATSSRSSANLGDQVLLRFSSAVESPALRWSAGFVDGGAITMQGALSADASLTFLGNDLGPPRFEGDFDYTTTSGEEIAGSGIKIRVNRVDLPERSAQYRLLLWRDTLGYAWAYPKFQMLDVNADLDKLFLLLVSKSAKAPKTKAAAKTWLKADFGEGLGAKLKSGSNEIELQYVDDTLEFRVGVARWANLKPISAEVTYKFSAPVEVKGALCSTVTTTYECHAGRNWFDREGRRGEHAHCTETSVIRIPHDCDEERITVTPSVKVVLPVKQMLELKGNLRWHRRAGVVEVHVGSIPIAPGWASCAGVPWVCLKWGWLPYPCWKTVKFPALKLSGINLGPWKIYETDIFSANVDVGSQSREDKVSVELTLEPFTIAVSRAKPLDRVTISSPAETKGGCDRETSCPRESYSNPGETVTIEFAGEGRPVEAWINGRRATLTGISVRDSFFSCRASRVLDGEDPDGPVEFLIHYETCSKKGPMHCAQMPYACKRFVPFLGIDIPYVCYREECYDTSVWVPGNVSETTDGTCAWNVRRPPDAPKLLFPADGIEVFGFSPLLEWTAAYDSSGREAETYEVAGSIETQDGEVTPFGRTLNCTTSCRLLSPLPGGCRVSWRVRAADVLGRWGPYSETAVFLTPGLVEISIGTTSDASPYCTVGDDVTVVFTMSSNLHGSTVNVFIGPCDADVTYQGSDRYVATCVMDDSTREGEIEFHILVLDPVEGGHVSGTETTDGSEVIFDSEPPEFDDCPEDITTNETSVDWDEPTVWDNGSGVASVTQTRHPGDTFPLGTTTVTYTGTDNAGNTATCEFDVTVTVADIEPPVFDDCPGDIFTETYNTSAAVSWDEPTAYDDDSGVASVTKTHHPGDTFPVGTTTVIYTATDYAGNSATCSFNVDVVQVQ
jgi:hypothetical protein